MPRKDAKRWSEPVLHRFETPEDLIAYAEPRIRFGQRQAFAKLIQKMRESRRVPVGRPPLQRKVGP